MIATIYLIEVGLLEGVTVPQETICVNGECQVQYPYIDAAQELYPYMLLNRVRTGHDAFASFTVDTNVGVVSGILTDMFAKYSVEDKCTPAVLTDPKQVRRFMNDLIDAGTDYCSMLTTYPDYPNCWDRLVNYLVENDCVPQEFADPNYAVVIDFKE
jgi:hypothetical protein